VLLIAAVTLGCSDSLSPRSVSGYYVLESVNGQSLPVEMSAIPDESTRVIAGSLMLTPEGFATTFEHRREVRQNVSSENSFSGVFTFEIDGNDITLFPICPPNALALCGTIEGEISGSRAILTIASSEYEYVRSEDF
jgi:hypothetical protein